MHTYLITYSTPDQTEPPAPVLVEAYDLEHARDIFSAQHPEAIILNCIVDD